MCPVNSDAAILVQTGRAFQRKQKPLSPLLPFKAMSELHRVRKASQRKPFSFAKVASSAASQQNILPDTSRDRQVLFGSSRAQNMIAAWMKRGSKASAKTPKKQGKKQKRKTLESHPTSPSVCATPTAKRRLKSASVHLKMDEAAVQRVRVIHHKPSRFVSRRF